MTTLAEINTAARRLVLLQTLAAAPQYQANSVILDHALSAAGLAAARSEVETQLRWLHDQGLVTVERIGPFLVATATVAGLDAAAGKGHVDGVARPDPRC